MHVLQSARVDVMTQHYKVQYVKYMGAKSDSLPNKTE